MYKFLINEEFSGKEFDINYRYDISLTSCPIDERSKFSKEIAKASSIQQIELYYEQETLSLTIDDKTESLFDFLQRKDIWGARSILFDATNLSFPELVIVLRLSLSLKSVGRIGFIYTEPAEYTSKVVTPLEIRGFDLSYKINPLDFIPRFYNALESGLKNYLLAFVGFEQTRLARLVDPDLTETFTKLSVAFSVPPFQAGWETHSLMAHSRIFENNKIEDAFFTPGNQPYESYLLIQRLKKADDEAHLTLAPFGTKPTSVAVALAAAEDENISVLFDFPAKKTDRSKGIGITHHYPILIE